MKYIEEEVELKYSDEDMISFAIWMRNIDTPINAEQYFHYSDIDMLNEWRSLFLKSNWEEAIL